MVTSKAKLYMENMDAKENDSENSKETGPNLTNSFVKLTNHVHEDIYGQCDHDRNPTVISVEICKRAN